MELQGTVIHRASGLTLSAGAAAAAVLVMLGQVWPAVGAAALLAVAWALLVDLDGGHGWLRRLLVLKRIGHNILIWRTRRLPAPRREAMQLGKSPQLTAPLDGGPVLLICAPADGESPPSRRRLHQLVLGFTLLGVAGLLLSLVSTTLLASLSAAALALLSLFALTHHLLAPPSLATSSAAGVIEALMARLAADPPQHITLAFALIEGLSEHHDGLEVLLESYRAILPPERVRVLVLEPREGPLALTGVEGTIRPRSIDPLLAEAAAALAPSTSPTSARRAMRLGWPAAGVHGTLSAEALLPVIDRLDAAAGEGAW